MHDYAFIMVIAGVLAAGAMSPGPSFLVVAKNALGKSRAHGLSTALGTGLGVAFFALLAGFGVTTLLDRVPTAFLVFKIIGGVYLIYLAWRIWQGAGRPLTTDGEKVAASGSRWNAFLMGLITQVSNPKTALVIAGIFAAFVPANPPQYTLVLVVIIAFVIDFTWYAFVAIGLSASRSRAVYMRAKPGFDRVAAAFLCLIGVRLILMDT